LESNFKSLGIFLRDERVGKYLVYHVDKGLSIVPTETLNHLSFMGVGEDVCDRGDAVICGEGNE
jgi:hypothetical protein